MLKKGDDSFEKVTSAVFDYADGFVNVVRQYTPANGTLAEQFNKTDGVPTSARDLTWCYVAFLTAVHARSAYLSPPASLPSTSSVALTNSSGACPDGGSYNGTVEVQFSVDNILLSGSAASLGAWNLSQTISLSAENYTASNPVWTTEQAVELPGRRECEYKVGNWDASSSFPNYTGTHHLSLPLAALRLRSSTSGAPD
ncbi:hypothetical protein JCM1841_000008 [Sporobolomyces salmonicolor]